MTYTYTYVKLEVSKSTYEKIANALKSAGYDHVFHDEGTEKVIDMHGLALIKKES